MQASGPNIEERARRARAWMQRADAGRVEEERGTGIVLQADPDKFEGTYGSSLECANAARSNVNYPYSPAHRLLFQLTTQLNKEQRNIEPARQHLVGFAGPRGLGRSHRREVSMEDRGYAGGNASAMLNAQRPTDLFRRLPSPGRLSGCCVQRRDNSSSYFLSSTTRARLSVVPVFSVLCDMASDQTAWPALSSRSSVLPSAKVYFAFAAARE